MTDHGQQLYIDILPIEEIRHRMWLFSERYSKSMLYNRPLWIKKKKVVMTACATYSALWYRHKIDMKFDEQKEILSAVYWPHTEGPGIVLHSAMGSGLRRGTFDQQEPPWLRFLPALSDDELAVGASLTSHELWIYPHFWNYIMSQR